MTRHDLHCFFWYGTKTMAYHLVALFNTSFAKSNIVSVFICTLCIACTFFQMSFCFCFWSCGALTAGHHWHRWGLCQVVTGDCSCQQQGHACCLMCQSYWEERLSWLHWLPSHMHSGSLAASLHPYPPHQRICIPTLPPALNALVYTLTLSWHDRKTFCQ